MAGEHPAVEIFCSYAQKDEVWLHRLETHLNLLIRQRLLSLWHNRLLAPGADRVHEVDMHLEASSVVLLLVSSDFLSSDYCYELEMQRALQRHEAGLARVIPIIVRSCDWRNTPLGKLQMLPKNGKPLVSWKDPDEALFEVAGSIRATLENFSLSGNSHLPTMAPAVWHVPHSRNTFFTGREHLLTSLHAQLQAAQTTATGRPLAISGLGGIGKTQLAIEYAYRHRQEYRAVLWVDAETKETLHTGYTEIARKLNLPQKNAQEKEIVVEAVKEWLSNWPGWLLILDNADDLALVHSFLPTMFAGHLLLTTRTQMMGRLAQRLEINTLDLETGALFLLRRAGMVAPDDSLEVALSSDIALAKEITQELGGLPLALDQAGAYIEETTCGLANYRDSYRTQNTKLLHARRGTVADHLQSVATTWSLSFKQVAQRNPMAADLLYLCAFLAPDAIPDEVVLQGIEILQSFQGRETERENHRWPFKRRSWSRVKPDEVATQKKGPLILDEAIATLRSYSLIARDPQARMLTIHSLVQAVLRDTLPVEVHKQWIQHAVSAVESTYPGSGFANWPAVERLLPHMLACANWIKQGSLTTPEAATLLNAAGLYLSARAQYSEAEPLLKRALAIREQRLGATHPDTAVSLSNLGVSYRAQGKYEEAVSLYKRALSINESIFGPEDSEVATNLNNLALVYKKQGKYAEADPLYQRARIIDEQVFGLEHPAVAIDLNNLGALYQEQGKYAEAESLLKRALSICEHGLEATHPDTAVSLNNLGVLYQEQGKYAEAESLLKRALSTREHQWGAFHPHTAVSLNSLGTFYRTQRKYEEAEPLLERALSIREQQLGATHPDTATSFNNLGLLCQAQGKYEEAKLFLKRALSIREQRLGINHSLTQMASRDYSDLLRQMREHDEDLPD